MAFQKLFARLLRLRVVIKDVERIIIFIFRVNTIAGKPAAQAVASVMHNGNGFHNLISANQISLFGKNAGDCAPRWDSHLSFFQHKRPLPYKIEKVPIIQAPHPLIPTLNAACIMNTFVLFVV